MISWCKTYDSFHAVFFLLHDHFLFSIVAYSTGSCVHGIFFFLLIATSSRGTGCYCTKPSMYISLFITVTCSKPFHKKKKQRTSAKHTRKNPTSQPIQNSYLSIYHHRRRHVICESKYHEQLFLRGDVRN